MSQAISGSVGNAADNKPADVLYIKQLVFRIPDGQPGGLNAWERSHIDPSKGVCEKELVEALARAQNMAVPSEKASGGRVVPYSKTLVMLQQNALAGQAKLDEQGAETRAAQRAGEEEARKQNALIDAARAKSLGFVKVTGTASAVASGKANGSSVLSIDLRKWLERLMPRKTRFKVSGGWSAQAGAGKWGGAIGSVEIIDTVSGKSRAFKSATASVGASFAPISFSYSGSDAPSGALTHLYQGPLNTSRELTLESFTGPCCAASGSVTGLAYGIGVTLYFLGFSYLDLGFQASGYSTSWETLQKAAGIGVVWGGQLGSPDAGVQLQAGKLLGDFIDRAIGLDKL